MAVRTTSTLVEEIIEVTEGVNLTPFISAASSLVDRIDKVLLDGVVTLSTGLSGDPDDDAILTQIETWLAAHFYSMFDPRPTAEGAGSVNASYWASPDKNLYLSQYGQMALTLDTTGTLKAISSTKPPLRASVNWAGTERDDE